MQTPDLVVPELAALAEADINVRAALAELVTKGLALPAASSPGDPSTN